MNYKIKDNLFLIISLSLVAIITVVLLIVLVDCEKEKQEPMLNVTLRIYVFSGDDLIAEYVLNKENDYYLEATLPYDGIKKTFSGALYLEDGTYYKTNVMMGENFYYDDGIWERCDEVKEKGKYDVNISCLPEPDYGRFPKEIRIRLLIE